MFRKARPPQSWVASYRLECVCQACGRKTFSFHFHFILLQQSSITSSSNIHWAGRKAPTTAHKLRTKDKIKTLRAISLLKHIHTLTRQRRENKNTHFCCFNHTPVRLRQTCFPSCTVYLLELPLDRIILERPLLARYILACDWRFSTWSALHSSFA